MRIFLIFCLLFLSFNAFADPWDDVTKEEAENVVAFLKQNPFILDYCDCCDIESVALLKVISVKIEKSDWKDGKYSVKTRVRKVADIPNTKNGGLQLPEATPAYGKDDFQITMNYTWVFNLETKKAAPLFDLVEYSGYSNRKPCASYTNYPNPFESECDVFPADYRDWYRLNVIY